MFYLIGLYGSRNKKLLAMNQLLIYTILGSLPFLISIIYIKIEYGTTNLVQLNNLNVELSWLCGLGILIAFLIKIPIFPFHIWLPLAHTEGSTSASIFLAAILLKLGTYGIMRFILPFVDLTIFLPILQIICL